MLLSHSWKQLPMDFFIDEYVRDVPIRTHIHKNRAREAIAPAISVVVSQYSILFKTVCRILFNFKREM